MSEAKSGDTVRVHYTGTLDNGSVFDGSQGRDPLEFTVGSGQVIPGFDQAVAGMPPGDEKQVTIPSAEAYGERRPEMTARVPRDQFPAEVEPAVGQQLQVSQDGQTFVVTVVDVGEGEVTLDGNHPLAGKDLTFNLELVEIVGE